MYQPTQPKHKLHKILIIYLRSKFFRFYRITLFNFSMEDPLLNMCDFLKIRNQLSDVL